MPEIFIPAMILLSLFSKKEVKPCYRILLAYSAGFLSVDLLTVKLLSVDYKTSIFIAMSVAFIALYSLTKTKHETFTNHSILLFIAIAIHFFQLLDIINLSSVVYDNYEYYITAITIMQLVISYESLHYAVINASNRFLLLLRGSYLYCFIWREALLENKRREGGA